MILRTWLPSGTMISASMPSSEVGERGYGGMRELNEFFENLRSAALWT